MALLYSGDATAGGPFSTISMLFVVFVGSEQHHGEVENPDG